MRYHRAVNAGEVLRQVRRRAGLSQRQLAERAATPQSTIARIEAGRSDPRAGTLERLLRACDHRLTLERRPGQAVDRSLIRQQLALTPRQRIEQMVQAATSVSGIQGAARRAR